MANYLPDYYAETRAIRNRNQKATRERIKDDPNRRRMWVIGCQHPDQCTRRVSGSLDGWRGCQCDVSRHEEEFRRLRAML